MSIEAMKQALEALVWVDTFAEPHRNTHKAITSLRQAIAEFDSHTLYREGYVNGYAFGEAAEREACAKLCEDENHCNECGGGVYHAELIRQRGQQ